MPPETFVFNKTTFTKVYISDFVLDDGGDDRFFYANNSGIAAYYNPDKNTMTFYKDTHKKLYTLEFLAKEPYFQTIEKPRSTFYKLADSENLYINPATLTILDITNNTQTRSPNHRLGIPRENVTPFERNK